MTREVREYQLTRRLERALQVHYTGDGAGVRAARDALRAALAAQPANLDSDEQLDYRERALADFDRAVARDKVGS